MTTLAQALARATYYEAHRAARRARDEMAAYGADLQGLPYRPRSAAACVYLRKTPPHNLPAPTLAQRAQQHRESHAIFR